MGTDLAAINDSDQPMAQIFFNSFGQKGTLAIWVRRSFLSLWLYKWTYGFIFSLGYCRHRSVSFLGFFLSGCYDAVLNIFVS